MLTALLGDLYSDWASSVKANGGTVVAFPPDAQSAPANGEFHGRPSGRYPAAIANSEMSSPDFTTPDGQYFYYLAPADVIAFVGAGGMVSQPSIDAGAAALKAQWLKDLEHAAKVAAVGAAIAGGLYLFLPSIRRAINAKRGRR